MKTTCILYATREGHTRKVAEHLADALRRRWLCSVQLWNIRDQQDEIHLDEFSTVILAASVHGGKHEPEMVQFVKTHRDELEKAPTAFLSVSLSEAGAEQSDKTPKQHARFVADVEKVLTVFFEQTDWRPAYVRPVAGALLYSKYNFLIRFVMKQIAKKAGGDTDTSRDYVYTDWLALDRFVDELAAASFSTQKA